MKKVLILNSSPRAKGNTELLARALGEGAGQAGHEVHMLDLRQMKIAPCLGCYQCLAKKGTPCIQKDDMQQVYDLMGPADVVVFASPLYWWHLNAQMKTMLDRVFAFSATGFATKDKEVMLLIAAEDSAPENFALIEQYYKTALVKNLNWTDRGMLLASGVNQVGDIAGTHWLEDARKLGAAL